MAFGFTAILLAGAAVAWQQPVAVLPDLRIVDLTVDPDPLPHRSTATLRLTVHNNSTVVAAGSILVEAMHDRGTPQPGPFRREILYLAADELAEVTFEVPKTSLNDAPYTFFAVIDVLDEIDEANEFNNIIWRRVDGCGATEDVEQVDGFDNDCDGLTDEGLGLSADPAAALEMLRTVQRQARRDAVPLIYAPARLFAPAPIIHTARLRTEDGYRVGEGREATAAPLGAERQELDAGHELSLLDWNGGDLRSGDTVSFLLPGGAFVLAVGGGGGAIAKGSSFREIERLFTLAKVAVAGADATAGDRQIRSGDAVAVVAWTGDYVSAEQGGGALLRADRASAGGWETFTLEFEPDGGENQRR